MNLQDLKPLVDAFEKWYQVDIHSKNEDYYKDIISKDNLERMNKEEFIGLFFQFTSTGGKIQSGGHRFAGKVKKSLEADFERLHQYLLAPFSSDFNDIEWLKQHSTFGGFGEGTATIYLNRVDKSKYCIVNNKSKSAFKNMGFKFNSSLDSTYTVLKNASLSLIKEFPSLNNFYKTDAISEFVSKGEGKELFDRILSDVKKKVRQKQKRKI